VIERDLARAARIRGARAVAIGSASVVALCCFGAFVSVWFVLVGTGACAVTAGAAFYAAYEGFDEIIRRPPR